MSRPSIEFSGGRCYNGKMKAVSPWNGPIRRERKIQLITRLPDLATIYTEDGAQSFAGAQGGQGDVRCALEMEGDLLRVTLCAQDTPVRFIRLRWRFTGEERRDDAPRIYGDAWERAGGALEWRGVVAERCMPWFCLVSNGSDQMQEREGRRTEGFGVKARPNALCFWQYDSAGIALWLDVRSGGCGVVLGGRTLTAAEVIFRTYRDCTAFEAGARFCREMCGDGLTTPEPVYGANNWYYAYGQSSAQEIEADARMLAGLCKGLRNRPFMVIDDGWSPNPKNGPWDRGNERFPDMAGLAAAIRAQDVRPGIWVRYISDENHVCGLPEEWHLQRDSNDLDPSRPEVLDYVRATTRRLVDWGYELIKFDCSAQDILGRRGYRVPFAVAEDGWRFHDRSRTSAEIVKDFYGAVRQAAGEDVVLIGTATFSHLSAGLVHLGRTGADVNGMKWDVTRRMGVNTLAFRMMMNGALFTVDADCAPLTGAWPWRYAGQWLDILAESGTPMFVSCRPGALNAEQMDQLRRAYARNSAQRDALIPLDWMENICPERWLLNGREVRFDWYADDVCAMFEGAVE